MLAVTGITGHTGQFFIEELVRSQYEGKIKCLVRTMAKADCIRSAKLDTEIIEGCLDAEADIRALLSGADTVVHIANIRYSPEIVRIGKECGVRRFILIHTTGIYSRYKSASQGYLDVEKQIIPQMKESNITILRPTMIFGDLCDYNISKFIRFVDALPILPVVAGGNALIQPVNARDLAQAIFKSLISEMSCGNAYDVSGEKAITIRELYMMISNCLNQKRLTVSLPMGLCVFGAYMLKALSLGCLDIIEKVQRMGENRAYPHDSATSDFGDTPEPFEIGLQREVKAYIAHEHAS